MQENRFKNVQAYLSGKLDDSHEPDALIPKPVAKNFQSKRNDSWKHPLEFLA